MEIFNIRTGGQAGVDRAVLDSALNYIENYNNNINNRKKYLTIKLTGWCPRGRRAEDGTIDRRYPLIETPSSEYEERALWNIQDADATLVFLLPGFKLSDFGPNKDRTNFVVEEAEKLRKPRKVVFLSSNTVNKVSEILRWIDENRIKMLNIAGSKESSCPGIYVKTYAFVTKLLDEKNNQVQKRCQSQQEIPLK